MRNRNVMPSLDLLAGFEAAARHLSFTKAGDELFLTQSAVSRQIKELEDQLGVALFHRRHRALVLTEAGQQFYAAAAQVLTTMRHATSRLKASTGRKPLSVTTTSSFAALWLIPRLAGFTRTHAGIDVRIPLVKDLLAEKQLVAPFKSSADPARSYFVITSPAAAGRPEVSEFVEWLKSEVAKR